ncbi:peptidylprolyl isomerase [Undibacterium sp. Ji42W]|uniref:peptidylprolyl isomerase n=1 Tax=Undibacterium sp. Ji42W TaxID=3413039 RepID=UPI003BF2373C
MHPHLNHLFRLAAIGSCTALFVLSTSNAHAGSRNIPTYERDESESKDGIVKRLRPDSEYNQQYKSGRLGVLLPSYERSALYLAYRALTLDQQTLKKQEQDTPAYAFETDIPKGGMDAWTAQRASVSDQPLRRPLAENRSFKGRAYGGYLNCTIGAYNFAAETLGALKSNNKISKSAVQEWVTAQDIVFDLCGDPEANTTSVIPQDLPASTPAYLRQLRQYQIATAYFYDEKFDEALRRFDAIAAVKSHPMSGWASHASLRALLRSGSLDDNLDKRLIDIRASNDTREQKVEAYNRALSEKQRKMAQIYTQIKARAKLILADKSRSKQHQAVQKLLTQAALYIVPEQVYTELSNQLGRFDKDVQVNGQLDNWSSLGDRLLDYRGNLDLLVSLRKQQEYFDWIRTIQACSDNPDSPNYSGLCTQEHQHALTLWQKTKAKTWLIASLMTARELTPQVEATFAPALQASADSKEYLTVRYYIARLMRQAGRRHEAVAIIKSVLAVDGTSIDPAILPESASANNLFRQEMLAMAKTEAEALPYLLRDSAWRIGADADALLNRYLSSEDLLRLAKKPATDSRMIEQLLMAAWWRSDMVGKTATAEAAARLLLPSQPAMAAGINAYLATNDAEQRHYYLARLAMVFHMSPQVYRIREKLGAANNRFVAANWWCSFNPEDFKLQARIQRVTPASTDISNDMVRSEAELNKLRQLGTAADWLARIVLLRAKSTPNDPALQGMADAVILSEKLGCISADSDALVNAVKLVRASMPPSKAAPNVRPVAGTARPVSEELVRNIYEKEKQRTAGKQQYRVSHILVKTEAEAKSALSKIQNGAKFDEVARQVSIDPGSKDKGGDLGWSLADVYVKPFADAITSIDKPERYPTPVQTAFGWHLIEVKGIRPFVFPSYEQAKPYIEEQLRQQGNKQISK